MTSHPRRLSLVALDDAYDPSRVKSDVDQLVDGDQVFAMVGNVGTAANLVSWAASEPACVPNLWAISGNRQQVTTLAASEVNAIFVVAVTNSAKQAINRQVMQRYDPATQTLTDIGPVDTNGQNAV